MSPIFTTPSRIPKKCGRFVRRDMLNIWDIKLVVGPCITQSHGNIPTSVSFRPESLVSLTDIAPPFRQAWVGILTSKVTYDCIGSSTPPLADMRGRDPFNPPRLVYKKRESPSLVKLALLPLSSLLI